jgi:hypothetical protein
MKKILLLAALLSVTAPAFAQTAIIDNTATAVTTDLSNLCPNQVVYEKRCLAPQYVVNQQPACAAPVMVEKRSHFLRFGLGPIIDLGLL